jgi:hypothetical protein
MNVWARLLNILLTLYLGLGVIGSFISAVLFFTVAEGLSSLGSSSSYRSSYSSSADNAGAMVLYGFCAFFIFCVGSFWTVIVVSLGKVWLHMAGDIALCKERLAKLYEGQGVSYKDIQSCKDHLARLSSSDDKTLQATTATSE